MQVWLITPVFAMQGDMIMTLLLMSIVLNVKAYVRNVLTVLFVLNAFHLIFCIKLMVLVLINAMKDTLLI